jgi:hypothetical protein
VLVEVPNGLLILLKCGGEVTGFEEVGAQRLKLEGDLEGYLGLVDLLALLVLGPG